MKSLYLLRHAKSSWSDATLADLDRPLNKRGRRDAPRMGATLAQRFSPLVFHVSPARRARLTFDGLRRGWPGLGETHCRLDEALYTFDVDDLVGWLATRDGEDRLALIGHNPAFTDVVNLLVGDNTLDNLPTAGWVELSLPLARWSEVQDLDGGGSLDFSLFPRELPDPTGAGGS